MAAKRTVAEQTREHVWAHETSKLLAVAPPWPVWLLVGFVGAVLHHLWPSWSTAVWVLVCGLALTLMAIYLTRHRKRLAGKLLGPGTITAAAVWLALCEVRGFGSVAAPWLIGGATTAIGWSMWLHIHGGNDEGHDGTAMLPLADAAKHTSVPGIRAWVVKVVPGKISGVIQHPKGVTSEQVIKAVPELESAQGLPRGSLKVTEHDIANRSNFTLTDPAALTKPRLWPGPSRPGQSIGETCRIGAFTDAVDWQVPCFPGDLPGWQCLVMGMTGAGKTTGLAYSWLGEIITRRDVAVSAIDLSKGSQFLGPMKPALHSFDTDYEKARARLWRLNMLRRERSEYLGTQGLFKWEPDCGLTALVMWLEEVAALFRQMGDRDVEQWLLPLVLEARSAGIFMLLSLQRADWTQIPTTVRAQLRSICMGVQYADDAAFGLSDDQKDHGCRPDLWKNDKPGMAYSDTPGLPSDEYKYAEARTYYWGKTAALIKQHAERYPADERPVDGLSGAMLYAADLSAPAVAGRTKPATKSATPAPAKPATPEATGDDPLQPPDEEEPMAPEPTPYDDPDLWRTEPGEDAPIPPVEAAEGEHTFGPPAGESATVSHLPLNAEQAAERLKAQVLDWWDQGVKEITLDMLMDLTMPGHENYIDRSRTWLYPAMQALVDDPAMGLVQLDRPRRWSHITNAA